MTKGVFRSIKSVLIVFFLTSLTLMALVLTGLYMALSPRLSVEQQLTELATTYAKLSQVNSFAMFNGEETYYSIRGTDDLGQEILVLLKAGEEKPRLLNLAQTLPEAEIQRLAQKAGAHPERLTFGSYQDHLVWEVKSQDQYYLFDAETGDLLAVWG